MARSGVEALQKRMLSGRRVIESHTMTGNDPVERSLFSRARPEFSAVAGTQLHFAAATDRIRFTLHNVASTVGHILATHKPVNW